MLLSMILPALAAAEQGMRARTEFLYHTAIVISKTPKLLFRAAVAAYGAIGSMMQVVKRTMSGLFAPGGEERPVFRIAEFDAPTVSRSARARTCRG